MNLKRLALVAIVLAGMTPQPAPAAAKDPSLTPDHVFALWTNINESLIASARAISKDALWQARVAATAPRAFADKTLADVLWQVETYRAKLDRLREQAGLGPTTRITEAASHPTLGAVYLSSGYVLNAQVEWLVRNTGPEQLISGFYAGRGVSGKTQSDIYALIELANRRLDQILARLRA